MGNPETTGAAASADPFISRYSSNKITGGVKTTARAKLKSSAVARGTPERSPVEIVAPEREKPRKGRQSPCTTPIMTEGRKGIGSPSPSFNPLGICFVRDPVQKIKSP